MKRVITTTLALLAATITTLSAQSETPTVESTKPTINMGMLLHTNFQIEQNGYGQNNETIIDDIDNPAEVLYGASVNRMRLMLESNLTSRDYIFVSTELSAAVGLGSDKTASLNILDAYYSHKFSNKFSVTAGKMQISYNRNGLQSAHTLMANDYSYFQYAYNSKEGDPLGNDAGRDIGINLTGGFNNNKFQYRLGAFSGCRDYSFYTDEESAPLRVVGRLQYNILGRDSYTGTNLGKGRTLAMGLGFDNQGGYYAVGADLFLDAPLGYAGSLTINTAYSYMSGGNIASRYNFASAIEDQNIIFAEMGYYIKSIKLQPWVKYELQDRTIEDLVDENVIGGGINYFFNGFGSNLKLSYVSRKNSEVGRFYGQAWVQLQLYIF